jgi:quercetin dioxygenase-like cupin family protein
MLGQRPISDTWEFAVPSLLHASGEGGRRPDEVAVAPALRSAYIPLMTKQTPTITSQANRPREGIESVFTGGMTWFSLLDSAITPTEGLSVGIAEFPKGCSNTLHWHAHPELYYILEGDGRLEVDDVAYDVHKGDAIHVPGNAKHTISNAVDEVLKLLYVFPANSLSEVHYKFPDGEVRTFEAGANARREG